MNDDPRVEQILSRWEALREQGQSLNASDLCQECPELADTVQQRINKLKWIDGMLDTHVQSGDTQDQPAERRS